MRKNLLTLMGFILMCFSLSAQQEQVKIESVKDIESLIPKLKEDPTLLDVYLPAVRSWINEHPEAKEELIAKGILTPVNITDQDATVLPPHSSKPVTLQAPLEALKESTNSNRE